MLGLLWFTVEEGIQGLKEIGLLEWISHSKSTHLHCEHPEHIIFHHN